MKNNWKLSLTGSLTAVLLMSSYAFAQTTDQKTTRHIRMMKMEDGKKMEIDTVLTGNEVFVWNGDTINPEKHIKRFRPSEFDKLHSPGMNRRQQDRRFFRFRDRFNGDPFIMHTDSGQALPMIPHEGDSLGMEFFMRKRFTNGDKDHFMYRHSPEDRLIPHAPEMPAVPHMRMFRNQSAKGINLNDPNIISFKKRNIGGGREKIEIIRKKTKKTENQDVDVDIDHIRQVPFPPTQEDDQN